LAWLLPLSARTVDGAFMSETFTYSQLITITVFLSVLIGLMFLAKRFKGPLKAQFGSDRRIKLIEDTGIGGHERIKLVEIDKQTYLVLTTKNQAPVMMPLETARPPVSTAQAKPIAKAPNSPSSGASPHPKASVEATATTPFLKAMQQARQRNPLLGLSQS